MIFARVSLLQQNSSPVVDHEDRESAMQQALKMGRLLGRGAHRPVAFVDQDQRFIGSLRDLHFVTRLAALALRRAMVLATSTTKRVWVPRPISSISSLAATSKVILRPSTANTSTVISIVIPGSVGARCLT